MTVMNIANKTQDLRWFTKLRLHPPYLARIVFIFVSRTNTKLEDLKWRFREEERN